MKKQLLTLLAAFGLLYNLSAQTFNPGTVASQNPPFADGTYRGLTQVQNATAATTSRFDTIYISPTGYSTFVQPSDSVTGSITYVIPSKPTNLYTGNELVFTGLSSNSGDTIRFRSNYGAGVHFKYITAADSTLPLTKKKRYVVKFIYDGYYMLETLKVQGE